MKYLLTLLLIALIGCTDAKPTVGTLSDRSPQIESVEVVDNQLSVKGKWLQKTDYAKLKKADGSSVDLEVVRAGRDEVILKPRGFVYGAYTLLISNAVASETKEVKFGVENGSITVDKLAPSLQNDLNNMKLAIEEKASIDHAHAFDQIVGLSDILAGKASIDHTHAFNQIVGLNDILEGKASKSDLEQLSPVAKSGNYNDLANKPFIPSKTSELGNDSRFVARINTSDALELAVGVESRSLQFILVSRNGYQVEFGHYFTEQKALYTCLVNVSAISNEGGHFSSTYRAVFFSENGVTKVSESALSAHTTVDYVAPSISFAETAQKWPILTSGTHKISTSHFHCSVVRL